MNTSRDAEQLDQSHAPNTSQQPRTIPHDHGSSEPFSYYGSQDFSLVPGCGGNAPGMPVEGSVNWPHGSSGAIRHSFPCGSTQDSSLFSAYLDLYHAPPDQFPARQSEWLSGLSSFPAHGLAPDLPSSASQPSLIAPEFNPHTRPSISTQLSYADQESAPSLIHSPLSRTHSGESTAYNPLTGFQHYDEGAQFLSQGHVAAASDSSPLHLRTVHQLGQPRAYTHIYPRSVFPPPADFKPENPSLLPVRQPLRFPADMYTPEWIRGRGINRQGYCTMCVPGRWLKLKSSSFWYHKTFVHGVSRETGREFERPVAVRWVDESNKAATSSPNATDPSTDPDALEDPSDAATRRISEPSFASTDAADAQPDMFAGRPPSTPRSQSIPTPNTPGASCQGLCAHCNAWIPLGDGRRTKVFGAAWFRHASKCQTRHSAPSSRRNSLAMGVTGTQSPRRHRHRASDTMSIASVASTPRSAGAYSTLE